MANIGYTNVCFTINGQLQMLLCHFHYFHFSIINLTFTKYLMQKTFIKINFQNTSKFLLFHKVLLSAKP